MQPQLFLSRSSDTLTPDLQLHLWVTAIRLYDTYTYAYTYKYMIWYISWHIWWHMIQIHIWHLTYMIQIHVHKRYMIWWDFNILVGLHLYGLKVNLALSRQIPKAFLVFSHLIWIVSRVQVRKTILVMIACTQLLSSSGSYPNRIVISSDAAKGV